PSPTWPGSTATPRTGCCWRWPRPSSSGPRRSSPPTPGTWRPLTPPASRPACGLVSSWTRNGSSPSPLSCATPPRCPTPSASGCSVLPNGCGRRERRVPMGVIGMVYGARPNVPGDAAGLALKSGNAVVLRGASAALHSNTALIAVLRSVLTAHDLPADLIVGIDEHGRAGVDALMRARGLVDVLIPRGGEGLIRRVVENSLVPVIETGTGHTHILVDAS